MPKAIQIKVFFMNSMKKVFTVNTLNMLNLRIFIIFFKIQVK